MKVESGDKLVTQEAAEGYLMGMGDVYIGRPDAMNGSRSTGSFLVEAVLMSFVSGAAPYSSQAGNGAG